MATQASYPLYNPQSTRPQETVSSETLRDQLKSFFKLHNPRRSDISEFLEFASIHGVLALNSVLKARYGHTLTSAYSFPDIDQQMFHQLLNFHRNQFLDDNKLRQFCRQELKKLKRIGLRDLNEEYEKNYMKSLSAFSSSNVSNWKKNWSSILQVHHRDFIRYELKRFFVVVKRENARFTFNTPFQGLVDLAFKKSRDDLNSRLRNKYGFCLDDVYKIPGTTREERIVNLRTRLVKFYQKYDPSKVEEDPSTIKNEPLPGAIKHRSETFDYQTADFQFVQDFGHFGRFGSCTIEEEAQYGIVAWEELNDSLRDRYGVQLEEEWAAKLRKRLINFYEQQGQTKEPHQIDRLVNYTYEHGLQALNKNLTLKYGACVRISDLEKY
eukprot:snap_masked-scaffold_12-processed-gene-0.51-mRNA-1 protein AED:1.00 eAED:1.00 QI:0/-1/0/0/-1/1/1/0/381